jgi:hypothetical protein
MAPADFELVINLIRPKTAKDAIYSAGLPVEERLVVTLLVLATGNSFTNLQYLSKISKQESARSPHSLSLIFPKCRVYCVHCYTWVALAQAKLCRGLLMLTCSCYSTPLKITLSKTSEYKK